MLRSPHRVNLRSERRTQRRRRAIAIRLALLLILFSCVMVLVVVVGRLDYFKVREINVDGNREISADDIRSVAEEFATGSVGYIFPRSNILLYPIGKAEERLKAKYPELSEVLVTRSSLSAIHVQVLERQPHALWCRSEALSDAECYLLDDKGYIYSRTTEDVLASSTPFIYFYGGVDEAQSSSSSPLGTTLNSSSTFSSILGLVGDIQAAKLDPFAVLIVDTHEFSILLSDGAEILFSDARPLEESFLNLKTALSSDAFRSTSTKATSTPKSFEYIDTRFGNKVFFKLKE